MFSDPQSVLVCQKEGRSQEGCQHEGLRGCGEHMEYVECTDKAITKAV